LGSPLGGVLRLGIVHYSTFEEVDRLLGRYASWHAPGS
jgi:selenocysteine lyase/cysteine desulfurase